MTSSDIGGTANTFDGSAGTVVQAGVVQGDVHINQRSWDPAPVPRQLPMGATGFVDRTEHLKALDTLFASAQDSVAVAALAGPPGVGKTALALHWARGARKHFTDGDLYVHLHGHTPGIRTEVSQALGTLLRALRVPPEHIPVDLDGRSALYRSLLDGKRFLILVEDALNADQVRPLLPASPGNMVLVTSRSTLSGLIARDGARRFSLSVLPAADSLSLLRHALGPRVDTDPYLARQLAEHCAHLPLALRVAAERLADRPDSGLSDLVHELDREESRLDALSEEDELSDLRAVMAASYRILDAEAARFFRLLGLHPGPEFSTPAAAALTGAAPTQARRLLDRLTRAHLVERVRGDRYRLHDLVRLYAVEQAREDGEPGEGDRAVLRAARWYTRAAARAQRAEHPHFPTVEGEDEGSPLPEFATAAEARDWFEDERANLLTAQRTAFDLGDDGTAWRLPASVYPLFELHRHWHEWRDMHRLGVQAAQRAGDAFGLARNRLGLGDAQWLLGDLDAAIAAYRAALEANTATGDPWIEGFTQRQLGVVLWEHGQRDGAAEAHVGRALEVFRSSRERRGEAMALLSLADFAADSGDPERALTDCASAVDVFDRIGADWSTAWARCTLGRALTDLGRAEEAVGVYRSAIAVFEEHGDEDSRAVALIGMGGALAATGDPGRAGEALRAALDYLHDHGDPRADEVAERLRALGSEP
ncbi:ATP-binding protein [Nocardiopsis sp. LOL_012]|uniref:ATP-binding protein n=1 Tax=Nocardiopsis sp. LOL_012 TaxID=3345409 RepID=UPI003A861C22